MASQEEEYNPDVYIEDFQTVHKIITSCIIKVDELLERGGTGDWLNSDQLKEIKYFKNHLHNIENELLKGCDINLEIKKKFGTNFEGFVKYNIPLSPMTEYPATNLTHRSQVISNAIEKFTSEIDLIKTMNDIVKNSNFVDIAKNIYIKASQEKWTIPLIVGGMCILALSGYCVANAYTAAGMDRKAKMEHLLEYRKLLDVKQILAELTSKNRLNESKLQTLRANVRIENQNLLSPRDHA